MELAPIEKALLRLAEDRVTMYRRSLEDCDPGDQRRDRIASELAEEERRLRERRDSLFSKNGSFSKC